MQYNINIKNSFVLNCVLLLILKIQYENKHNKNQVFFLILVYFSFNQNLYVYTT